MLRTNLHYSDGCASYVRALENLEEALRLEQVAAEVSLIHAGPESDAQAHRFIGSPTIRINGEDLDESHAVKMGYGFG